jgi:hypothetical protein
MCLSAPRSTASEEELRKAKKWLEANVPEDDVLEPDLELDGLVVVNFEPLMRRPRPPVSLSTGGTSTGSS